VSGENATKMLARMSVTSRACRARGCHREVENDLPFASRPILSQQRLGQKLRKSVDVR